MPKDNEAIVDKRDKLTELYKEIFSELSDVTLIRQAAIFCKKKGLTNSVQIERLELVRRLLINTVGYDSCVFLLNELASFYRVEIPLQGSVLLKERGLGANGISQHDVITLLNAAYDPDADPDPNYKRLLIKTVVSILRALGKEVGASLIEEMFCFVREEVVKSSNSSKKAIFKNAYFILLLADACAANDFKTAYQLLSEFSNKKFQAITRVVAPSIFFNREKEGVLGFLSVINQLIGCGLESVDVFRNYKITQEVLRKANEGSHMKHDKCGVLRENLYVWEKVSDVVEDDWTPRIDRLQQSYLGTFLIDGRTFFVHDISTQEKLKACFLLYLKKLFLKLDSINPSDSSRDLTSFSGDLVDKLNITNDRLEELLEAYRSFIMPSSPLNKDLKKGLANVLLGRALALMGFAKNVRNRLEIVNTFFSLARVNASASGVGENFMLLFNSFFLPTPRQGNYDGKLNSVIVPNDASVLKDKLDELRCEHPDDPGYLSLMKCCLKFDFESCFSCLKGSAKDADVVLRIREIINNKIDDGLSFNEGVLVTQLQALKGLRRLIEAKVNVVVNDCQSLVEQSSSQVGSTSVTETLVPLPHAGAGIGMPASFWKPQEDKSLPENTISVKSKAT